MKEWIALIESSLDGTCQTPGSSYEITVGTDELGGTVTLPPEIALDLDEPAAQRVEDMLHDALEAVVAKIVAEFDADADDHWIDAARNDPEAVDESQQGGGHDGDGYFDQAAPSVQAEFDDARSSRSRTTLVYMSPADFLRMALDENDPAKQAKVDALVERGVKFNSLPMLKFVHDGKGVGRVEGHEGRHRARALRRLGVTSMPVILYSQGGGGGNSIRWGSQEPGSFDYVTVPPRILKGETSGSIPMPQSAIFPDALKRT